MTSRRSRRRASGTGVLLALAVAACARGQAPHDPFEGVNRRVFAFNEVLDTYVVAPAATAWDALVPREVQFRLVGLFANLRGPLNSVNLLLQGEPREAGVEAARFVINSTAGVLGLFDPAERWGLEANPTDLGLTLARWGVAEGPYLVLPVLGPADGTSLAAAAAETPVIVALVHAASLEVGPLALLGRVNERAYRDRDIEALREAALDDYVAVRSLFLERREIDP